MSSIWTKTMLSVWGKLPSAINSQERYINTLVNRSMFGREDAWKEIERIRTVILRKKDLQYFMSIIDEIYADMTNRSKDMLRLRFVEGISMPQIASRSNTPLRTVYRTMEKLIKSFENMRKALEYDDDYLAEEFMRERIIYSEYRHQYTTSFRVESAVNTRISYYIGGEVENLPQITHNAGMNNILVSVKD